jgi:hypothetical protein
MGRGVEVALHRRGGDVLHCEVNTLRGLLPICARCRKVRDDQNYWHNIDGYLRKQLNMKLAQGLCPTCFAEGLKAAEEQLKSAARPEDGIKEPLS